MRKIIVYNILSLDGYHTGPGHDISVMFPMMGGVFDTYNAELLRTADVHLVGRVSFEMFQRFWPQELGVWEVLEPSFWLVAEAYRHSTSMANCSVSREPACPTSNDGDAV